MLGGRLLTADEKLSLVFQLKWGIGEVADVFTDEYHVGLLKTLLAFEELYLFLTVNEKFSHNDLRTLQRLVQKFLQLLERWFSRLHKAGNMCKPKVHALVHLVFWLKHFGAHSNGCTSLFEMAHKRCKTNADRTNHKDGKERTMVDREGFISSLTCAKALVDARMVVTAAR